MVKSGSIWGQNLEYPVQKYIIKWPWVSACKMSTAYKPFIDDSEWVTVSTLPKLRGDKSIR